VHIASGAGLGPAAVLAALRSLAEVEKAHIIDTLERSAWNHSRAAEALGIGRTTLWRKLKE
jgi:sigma-54 dependent transcriptional regulator, acetoin dehydrogenase operon transcriptional activator AcoR